MRQFVDHPRLGHELILPADAALRLYDSLGLLTPAHVDEVSGYRFYRPDQLERARLVAWLRRLGMPLARIRVVCDLAPDAPGEVPALYLAAEDDVPVPLEDLCELFGRAPAPKRIFVPRRADHQHFVDVEAALAARGVDAFAYPG